ncbi:MAG: HU family DNA-binding protein [Deltaproteobacteria bacterium]|nr:HU family DNA-binding protein [Deltaproteobacteria bacterium]
MAKMTKSQIVTCIAEKTGLSRKLVAAVFDVLGELAVKELGKKGPGEFAVLPGFVKAKVRVRAAVPAGKRINPFTKQEEMRKAKPARRVVRFAASKVLEEGVKQPGDRWA